MPQLLIGLEVALGAPNMLKKNVRLPLLVMSVITLVLLAGIFPSGHSVFSSPIGILTSLEPLPSEAGEKRRLGGPSVAPVPHVADVAGDGASRPTPAHISVMEVRKYTISSFLNKHSDWLWGALPLLALLAAGRVRRVRNQAR